MTFNKNAHTYRMIYSTYFILLLLQHINLELIYTAFSFSECGSSAKGLLHTRIVGGRDADANEYPWLVALIRPEVSTGTGQFCGAALLSDRFVITAAHCVAP